MRARFSRLDGCHVDEQRAGGQGFGHALAKQHISHHWAALQQADSHVCLAHGISCLLMHLGTIVNQEFGLAAGAVPGVYLVACLAQAPCYW